MEDTFCCGGGGLSIRIIWEATPLSLILFLLLTLEGVPGGGEGCLPGALSSLWRKAQCL